VRDPRSRVLEKEADKLLKAYELADKWKANRQNKNNVTQTKKKDLTKKGTDKSVQQ